MKRHPALWLTIILAAFYILFGNLRATSGDGEAMLQVTRALAEQGRLDLGPGTLLPVETMPADTTNTQIPYTLTGRDGRTYSKYGLGQSLVALPLYLLGMAWRAATGAGHAPRSAALLLNSLLTASTAGLLLIMVRDLGYSTRAGVTVALAYALCSPAWVYTHTFFSEPLVTLSLTGAALAAWRFAQKGRSGWLIAAGGALGLALLARVDALAAFPAFGLYLVLTWRAQGAAPGVIVRQATTALLGFSLGAALTLLYNILRSGEPLDFGYRTSNWQTPFWRGLYGLTLSPGKGLLWYAPVLVLGLIGLRRFARRWPREALLCAGISLGYLLLHSFYTYWDGGWAWGPRLLLPALPFLLLPAAAILDHKVRSQAFELAIALLLVLGLVVQVPAVGGNYAHTLQRIYAAWPDDFEARIHYRPQTSPLIMQWQSFLQVSANLQDPSARDRIAELLQGAEPDNALPLADSPAEALRLEQQAILAFNLPDLWLVSAPWLGQEADR
jgi:hypothetical protein